MFKKLIYEIEWLWDKEARDYRNFRKQLFYKKAKIAKKIEEDNWDNEVIDFLRNPLNWGVWNQEDKRRWNQEK